MHASHRSLAFVLITAGLAAACRSTAPAPAAVSANTWAVVDGQEITRDEVEKAFRRIGDPSRTLSDEEAIAAKLALLDDMIVEEVLLAKAAAQKLVVSDTELDAAYAAAKKDIPDDAFQQELTRRNLTAADMRDGLRRELLAKKVVDQEVVSKIAVSDQEVTTFFNANQSQFNFAEDAYHLAQIIVTPVRDTQIANRTGDDAATPQAAAAKVAMLMERLKSGTPFGDLARDFSEDPESAPRGGDMGLVPVSAIRRAPAALRDAVLNTEPGRASVVQDGNALRIVLVVSREKAGQRDLSTPGTKEQITQAIRTRKEQLLRDAYLNMRRADAEVTNYLARRLVERNGKL